MKDILDTQEFYELMQDYRHCNLTNQEGVVEMFEEVKNFIRGNKQSINSGPEPVGKDDK